MPIIQEAISLGILKLCQMLDWSIVFKTWPHVLVLHNKSSRKHPPNLLRSFKCVAMYIHVWGSEYMSLCACVCKHDRMYIEEASIYLFWMQIKLQQSFLETLLLGNLCLLCNLVGLLYIVCDGTVCLLDWGFMRTFPSTWINLHNHWRRSIRCAQGRFRLWSGLKCGSSEEILHFEALVCVCVCEHKFKKMHITTRADDVK